MSPLARLAAAFSLALLVGGALGACDTRSKCARVVCTGGKVCEEASGLCRPGDGGTGDDGGTDGSIDGGATCTPACTTPPHCNPATNTCVECLSNADCACPSPTCAAGSCTAAIPPVPAPGEDCASAPTIRSCHTALHFTVDLTSAKDDAAGSCSAANGGGHDVMYVVALDGVADLRVTAQPAAGSRAQPVVYLRRGTCAPADELACADGLGGPSSFRVRSLPAGTYVLVIDSFDAASVGAVDVLVEELTATQPANDTCGTAAPLPLDGGRVEVDLTNASADTLLACTTATDNPDVFYHFTLETPGDLVVTSAGADAGVDTVLALRSDPCATGTTLACVDAFWLEPERLRARALPAGGYTLVVQAFRSSAGPVVVAATATQPPAPAPANDTCAAPRAIAVPPGSFTTDTFFAADDEVGSCNPTPNSPELVYALNLTAARTVTITALGDPAPSTAAIYLRSGACHGDAGVEVGCDLQLGGGAATIIAALQPGTYFLFVEGQGLAGAGPVTVTVTLTP